MLSKTLKVSAFIIASIACDTFAVCSGSCDDAESIFQCEEEMDFLLEGWWDSDVAWKTHYFHILSSSLLKSEIPDLGFEYRKVEWELADVHYRRLTDGGSRGEWHTEILGPIYQSPSITSNPIVNGYPSVGCVPHVLLCYDDATKLQTYALDPIDLSQQTFELFDNIKNSQSSFSEKWNGEGNRLYRGSRYPKSYSLSVPNRNSVISTASAIMDYNIDYTWADMLENKWDWWGNTDWDGSIGDIDEIRCDGVAEYAYEKNGFRVWGSDSYWNSGSGSDAALDNHNELWEHDSYDYGELSPVIQAGCGGYGDGERTTMRQRNFSSPPKIGDVTLQRITPNPSLPNNYYYLLVVSEIYDSESNGVYLTIQTQNANGSWQAVSDDYYTWNNIPWSGSAGVTFAINAKYPTGSFFQNQKWRIIAIDQGGNSSIWESAAEPYLAYTNDFMEFKYVADADGVFKFMLTGILAGADLDLVVYDDSHGGVAIASSALGGNSNETVSFFALKGTKLRFKIYSYFGSSSYKVFKNGFMLAELYKPGQSKHLSPFNNYSNGLIGLPSSNGWAISWGSNWSNNLDVDMRVLNPSGSEIASSTGSGPTELILGNFPGLNLSIYEYNQAISSLVRVYRIK